MSELPWDERINMISINPHAATIDDIARLAAELRESRERIESLEGENALLKAGADPGPELSTITTT